MKYLITSSLMLLSFSVWATTFVPIISCSPVPDPSPSVMPSPVVTPSPSVTLNPSPTPSIAPSPMASPLFATQGVVRDVKALGGISQAVAASKDGDTILFQAGTYSVPARMTLPGNRLYLGQGTAIIHGPGPQSDSNNAKAFNFNTPGAKIQNLTFDNGGIRADGTGTQGLVVDNCVFTGPAANVLEFHTSLTNAKITNNSFHDLPSGFSVYGDGGYNGLTIANNEVVNACGFHIGNGSANFLFEQNYLSGVPNCPGAEFQEGPSGVTIQDNWFEKPKLSTTASQNTYALGFSLPLNNSSNVEIRRNVMLNPERPDGVGVRFTFELGGKSTIVEDNHVEGFNVVFADTDGTTSNGSVTARNNFVSAPLTLFQFAFPGSGRTFTQTNNGTQTQTTWNISRGRPGRNKRY